MCVYTCLIGEYEELNELSDNFYCSVPHICFTDSTALKSDTWEIRLITPIFPMDTVRSQRHVKILSHEYLSEFTTSLYMDSSIRLHM
jgi:hypothetical protein